MTKPGLERALPAAFLGFIAGCLIVVALRAAQSMDPVWDVGVAVVVAPFTMVFAFIWGMGGFDPRMSEHAHGPDHAHEDAGSALATLEGDKALAHAEAHSAHAEEADPPARILSMEIWRIAAITIVVMLGLFAFAMLPTGLTLEVTNDPEASRTAFDSDVEFTMPLGQSSFEGTQLSFFVGFLIVMFVSLFAVAGGLGLLFTFLNRQVAEAAAITPTPKDLTPPAPVRALGRLAGWMAKGLRAIPRVLGQK